MLVYLIPFLIPSATVVVSPARLSLGEGYYKPVALKFNFYNRSSQTLYNVWAKITILSDSITYKDLTVRFDNSPSKEFVLRYSTIDSKERKAEYFLINKILAHDTYVLSLGDTRVSPISNSDHFLVSEILAFSYESRKLQQRKNAKELLLKMTMPEDMSVVRIWEHNPWQQGEDSQVVIEGMYVNPRGFND